MMYGLEEYMLDCELERDMNSYFNQSFGTGPKMVYTQALKNIGYFDAPASKGHHLAKRNGLLRHSVNVTRRLLALTDVLGVCWPRFRPSMPWSLNLFTGTFAARRTWPPRGGTERDWNHYRDVENAILDELGKRFPGREMRGVRGYLDKKPGEIDSLKAVYAKIFKKGKVKK